MLLGQVGMTRVRERGSKVWEGSVMLSEESARLWGDTRKQATSWLSEFSRASKRCAKDLQKSFMDRKADTLGQILMFPPTHTSANPVIWTMVLRRGSHKRGFSHKTEPVHSPMSLKTNTPN